DPGFAQEVKRITGGGAKAAIEVTGVGAGLDGALDAMARFGRVALLGCTRDKEFTIDYYRKVHCPGITLIGAHTDSRPEFESRPGVFTTQDDIRAMLALLDKKRLSFDSFPHAKYAPAECGEAFARLINDRNFPLITQFDWAKL
ncbi:MAG: theronine dehydrogenase, partial [Clostridia bacterium]|nr:theronine dehydrogenase [Clostridia bacterium]